MALPCPHCRYDLRAHTGDPVTCPECGAAHTRAALHADRRDYSRPWIVALLLTPIVVLTAGLSLAWLLSLARIYADPVGLALATGLAWCFASLLGSRIFAPRGHETALQRAYLWICAAITAFGLAAFSTIIALVIGFAIAAVLASCGAF